MPKKRFSSKQTAALLRQIEVATSQGKMLYIEPGSPWEAGYRESADGNQTPGK